MSNAKVSVSDYLLDTNVVSELTKEVPAPAVIDFLSACDDLWLSVIVVEELELSIQLLPEGRRRDGLREWLTQLLADFGDRIAPIGRHEAEWAAALQARVHRTGGELDLGDALIAGTAIANELTIVTRNIRDFEGIGIEVFNPWKAP